MSDELDERYDEEEEEPYQSSYRWLQPLILSLAVVLVIAMAGVPVLRIFELLQEEDESLSIDERARRNTALLFAEAALERRSTNRAEAFVTPELHDQVDTIIGDLQSREPSSLDGASVTVASINCTQLRYSGGDCFQASLSRDDGPPLMTVQYAVENVNNSAIVVAIERPGVRI